MKNLMIVIMTVFAGFNAIGQNSKKTDTSIVTAKSDTIYIYVIYEYKEKPPQAGLK